MDCLYVILAIIEIALTRTIFFSALIKIIDKIVSRKEEVSLLIKIKLSILQFRNIVEVVDVMVVEN